MRALSRTILLALLALIAISASVGRVIAQTLPPLIPQPQIRSGRRPTGYPPLNTKFSGCNHLAAGEFYAIRWENRLYLRRLRRSTKLAPLIPIPTSSATLPGSGVAATAGPPRTMLSN